MNTQNLFKSKRYGVAREKDPAAKNRIPASNKISEKYWLLLTPCCTQKSVQSRGQKKNHY
jgi:hypothetical protein